MGAWYLDALHEHMGDPAPFYYCLWFVLNPENDGTTIWVDLWKSGAWASERVF